MDPRSPKPHGAPLRLRNEREPGVKLVKRIDAVEFVLWGSPVAYGSYMKRTFVVTFAVGLIVALFGLIWALQGFGVLGGSPMSNTTTWSIIGPFTAVIGIVMAILSWRKLSSK